MNNWLLDTNALIWYFQGSPRMSPVQEIFLLPDTKVYYSSVSLWEIALKFRIGKLPINVNQLVSFLNEYDFNELAFTGRYIQAYLDLTLHHKDPFDHMILAQALTCPMRLITGDEILKEYSSLVMLV